MLRISAKTLLLSLALSCLPLMSQAATDQSQTTSATSAKAVINWWCSPSNNHKFRGSIIGHTVVSSGYSYFQVEKYKIERFEGQSGGNKANLSIWMGSNGDFSFFNESGDNLMQDSQWHDLNLRVNYPGAGTQVKFKFTFDKSWSDPTCEAIRPA
ncbi:hypothetical protein [Pseudomonas sp. PB3P13]